MIAARDAGLPTDLRAALAAAGYTFTAVAEALTVVGDAVNPRPEEIPPLLHLLHDSRLHDLIRLLLLDYVLPADRVDAALAPITAERATEAGLLRRLPNGFAAAYRVVPLRNGPLVVVDPPSRESAADFVMGMTVSSSDLAHLTVRRPVRAALDVGTGCGVQALLAARHAERVVATDVNPRALSLARFNARLDEADNVELRAGSLFEPVAGERFDLVVANPPFVVSPDSTLLYRDGAGDGDAFSRTVVEQVPEHLEEGGVALVLVNWVHEPADWAGPVRRWVDGRGCDAWLLRFSTDGPLEYAANWSSAYARDPEEHGSVLGRWLTYLERLGVGAISYGAVVLRRRAGQNWTRADDVPGGPGGPAGDQVARLLDATTRLVELPDARSLLAAVLRVDDRHHVQQVLRRRDGRYTVESASLRVDDGLAFQAAVDGNTVTLLSHIDGRRPLSEAIAEAAAGIGTSPAHLAEAALPVVHRMLQLGLVVLV